MSNPFAPPETVDEAKPADVYVSTSWYGDVRETVRLWIEAWPVLLAWVPILAVVDVGRMAVSGVSSPLGLLYAGTITAMAGYGVAISAVVWHHRELSGRDGVRLALREGAARGPWAFVSWIVPGFIIGIATMLLVVPGLIVASEYGLLTVVIACEGGGGGLAAHRSTNRRRRILALAASFWLTAMTLGTSVGIGLALALREISPRLALAAVVPMDVLVTLLQAAVTLSMYVVWREAWRGQAPQPGERPMFDVR